MSRRRLLSTLFSLLILSVGAFSQTAITRITASVANAVPPLVPYSGVVEGRTGLTTMTFLIFKEESGGEPVFTETQSVALNAEGQYKVTLGATLSAGLPSDLFATGEGRWLEVQVAGNPAQPRVLLVSVPYAMKAADAETLGGLPASAFMLAGQTTRDSTIAAGLGPNAVSTVTTTGGAAGFVPEFSGAATIVNSPIFVSGANVGIGTTAPTTPLTVNGNTTLNGAMTVTGDSTYFGSLVMPSISTATPTNSFASQFIKMQTSAYNSATKTVVSPRFQWQALVTGNNTANPGATLDLYASAGPAKPAATGFFFNTDGTIHFAPGQTFPGGTGTGTITGVTAGTALTGGGTTGTVILNVDTTKVPLLAANNTFTGNQTVTGAVVATETSGNGVAVTGNASAVGVVGNSIVGAIGNGFFVGTVGNALGGDGASYGLIGNSNGTAPGIAGVRGDASATTTSSNTAPASFGVVGTSASSAGVGVAGLAPQVGVIGYSGADCNTNPATNPCALTAGFGGAFVSATGGFPLSAYTGTNIDDWVNNPNAIDFYVDASGNGFFKGNLSVTGTLSKGGGSFKIDDPLDPANKYLSHSFVESPDMMNVYNGNIKTDKRGIATVELPEYFESLNRDFRYQLTVMGQFAQAIVAKKISGNHFLIRTSKPNIEVSWQVTGIRQDAYANTNRIPVEEDKPENERGYYLHPEAFGQPESKGIVVSHMKTSSAPTVAQLGGTQHR